MPEKRTVLKWLASLPEFVTQYAHAREAQADAYADEIAEIADDGKRDYTVDADGVAFVDHDHIARARLRVDARKWIASKLKPKKYGDKLTAELSGPNGGPIETKSSVTTPGSEALLRRLRARLDRSAAIGTPEGDAAVDPDGSVLPAEVRAGSDGHGASLDARPDSGSAA